MNPLFSTPAPTAAQQAATQILSTPLSELQRRIAVWSVNMNLLWRNNAATPAAILSAMGTNAANIFALNVIEVQYLESLQPGCTTSVMDNVLPFTPHPDGTVTLN
jgi:hypothetical protein